MLLPRTQSSRTSSLGLSSFQRLASRLFRRRSLPQRLLLLCGAIAVVLLLVYGFLATGVGFGGSGNDAHAAHHRGPRSRHNSPPRGIVAKKHERESWDGDSNVPQPPPPVIDHSLDAIVRTALSSRRERQRGKAARNNRGDTAALMELSSSLELSLIHI